MNIPNLNLFRRIRKPNAVMKMSRKHYGIKFLLPEGLTEDELLKLFVRIPADKYKLPENQGFVLNFGARVCSRRLILHMLNSIVWEKNIKILAWLSSNEDSVKLFQAAGLSTVEPEMKKPEPEIELSAKEPEKISPSGLKVVYNSMRSGQSVQTDGDVIVWGHLNAGAEISAGGSVIIAGRLQGLVHAGASGRSDVFLWAGSFETPQVRIENKICYAGEKSSEFWRKSVLITLEDGTPVIRENKFFMNLR